MGILYNSYDLVFTPELAKAKILSSDPKKKRVEWDQLKCL